MYESVQKLKWNVLWLLSIDSLQPPAQHTHTYNSPTHTYTYNSTTHTRTTANTAANTTANNTVFTWMEPTIQLNIIVQLAYVILPAAAMVNWVIFKQTNSTCVVVLTEQGNRMDEWSSRWGVTILYYYYYWPSLYYLTSAFPLL